MAKTPWERILKKRRYSEDKLKTASKYFSRDGSFEKAKWRLENHYMGWTDRAKTNFGRVRAYERSHDRLKRFKTVVPWLFCLWVGNIWILKDDSDIFINSEGIKMSIFSLNQLKTSPRSSISSTRVIVIYFPMHQ